MEKIEEKLYQFLEIATHFKENEVLTKKQYLKIVSKR